MMEIKWFFFCFFLVGALAQSNSSCFLISSQGCDACISHANCVYCEDEKLCVDGSVVGPTNANHTCKKWFSTFTCKVDTLLIWILTGTGVGLILVITILLLCKCMCCSGSKIKSRNDNESYEYEQLEENKPSLTPKNDEQRRKLEEKYPELKFGGKNKTNSN